MGGERDNLYASRHSVPYRRFGLGEGKRQPMPLDTVFHTGGLVWGRGKRQPMPLDTVFHTGGLVWGRGKRQPMPLDTVFHTGGLVWGRGRDNLCL